MRSPILNALPADFTTEPVKQRINSFVATTKATAIATTDKAKVRNSVAQIIIRPSNKINNSALRDCTNQRWRSSDELTLLRIKRPNNNRNTETMAINTTELAIRRNVDRDSSKLAKKSVQNSINHLMQRNSANRHSDWRSNRRCYKRTPPSISITRPLKKSFSMI